MNVAEFTATVARLIKAVALAAAVLGLAGCGGDRDALVLGSARSVIAEKYYPDADIMSDQDHQERFNDFCALTS